MCHILFLKRYATPNKLAIPNIASNPGIGKAALGLLSSGVGVSIFSDLVEVLCFDVAVEMGVSDGIAVGIGVGRGIPDSHIGLLSISG